MAVQEGGEEELAAAVGAATPPGMVLCFSAPRFLGKNAAGERVSKTVGSECLKLRVFLTHAFFLCISFKV